MAEDDPELDAAAAPSGSTVRSQTTTSLSSTLVGPKRYKIVDHHLANDGVRPTDVLHDILLRLPAKALRRLRLVCRSWRRLTMDPIFVEAHTSRHPLIVGVNSSMNEMHIVDLLSGNMITRKLLPRHCWIAVSAQLGMVCLSSPMGPNFVLREGTHEISELPEHPRSSSSCYPYVLGYVPSTGEYKVLKFHLIATNGDHWNVVYVQPLHVMTFRGQGWRVAARCPVEPVDPNCWKRAVIDGVAYFLFNHYVNSPDNLEPDSIALFDLATEEWSPTPLRGPVSSFLMGTGGGNLSFRRHRGCFHLTEVSGSLVAVHCRNQDWSADIWFLVDKHNGVWSKRYSMQCATERGCRNLYPLVVLDDGRIIVWMNGERAMRIYDPTTSTRTVTGITERMYDIVHAYVGSLLLC